MVTKTIRQTVTFKASPHAVYEALMDAKKHAAVTGAAARISRKVGGPFSLFDGYASGNTVVLAPDKKIVQDWRAEEPGWPADHYSRVTFALAAVKGGTKLTFTHAGVPAANATSIASGWHEYYWEPLTTFLKS